MLFDSNTSGLHEGALYVQGCAARKIVLLCGVFTSHKYQDPSGLWFES